jgi:hypothetical protein
MVNCTELQNDTLTVMIRNWQYYFDSSYTRCGVHLNGILQDVTPLRNDRGLFEIEFLLVVYHVTPYERSNCYHIASLLVDPRDHLTPKESQTR